MRKIRISLVALFTILFICGCITNRKNADVVYKLFTLSKLSGFLGMHIDSVKFEDKSLFIVNGIDESDEGVLFYTKSVSREGRKDASIIFETRTLSDKTVNRIIIKDTAIVKDYVYVGQNGTEFKNFLASKKPEMPDGYLYFKLKNCSKCFIEVSFYDQSIQRSFEYIDQFGKDNIDSNNYISMIVLM